MNNSPVLKALMIMLGLQVLLAWSLSQPTWLQRIEAPLEDWRITRLAPSQPQPIDQRIVLIDINEASLAQEGRWPWPRERIADLLEQMLAHQPVLIGIDILMPEAGTDDARLHELLQHPGITTSLVWSQTTSLQKGPWPQQAACTNCTEVPQVTGWINNAPMLQGRQQAHITPITDQDGRTRHIHPLACYRDHCVEALALSLSRQLLAESANYSISPRGTAASTLHNGAQSIPLEYDTHMRIPWYTRAGTPAWISAGKLLNQSLPANHLKGRVLILGSSAVGLHDHISTPLSANYPAVATHAHLLQALIDQQPWYTPALALPLSLLVAIITGMACAALLITSHPLLGTGSALFANLLWLTWVFQQQRQGLFWPHAPVLLSSLLSIGVLMPWLARHALATREHLKRQFKYYVAPQVLKHLEKNPQDLIGSTPKKHTMTVLFADLRHFSRYADNTDPAKVAQTLEIIMDSMTEVIHAHGGTVDKYMGDAVMAFWGAPLRDDQHPLNALEAAIDLYRVIDRLSKTHTIPAFTLSIGLNSGTVVIGEMGSSHRRSYTLIGAPVNLAAHLEVATRLTNAPILVGAGTQALIPDYPWPAPLTLNLPGHTHPISAWPISPQVNP